MGDVAEAVGVHCSTVSRVLGGKGGRGRIAPATQERIRLAARQLGYVAKPPVLLRRSVVELPCAELLQEVQAVEPVVLPPVAQPAVIAEPVVQPPPASEVTTPEAAIPDLMPLPAEKVITEATVETAPVSAPEGIPEPAEPGDGVGDAELVAIPVSEWEPVAPVEPPLSGSAERSETGEGQGASPIPEVVMEPAQEVVRQTEPMAGAPMPVPTPAPPPVEEPEPTAESACGEPVESACGEPVESVSEVTPPALDPMTSPEPVPEIVPTPPPEPVVVEPPPALEAQ